jgi:hypothetical protein
MSNTEKYKSNAEMHYKSHQERIERARDSGDWKKLLPNENKPMVMWVNTRVQNNNLELRRELTPSVFSARFLENYAMRYQLFTSIAEELGMKRSKRETIVGGFKREETRVDQRDDVQYIAMLRDGSFVKGGRPNQAGFRQHSHFTHQIGHEPLEVALPSNIQYPVENLRLIRASKRQVIQEPIVDIWEIDDPEFDWEEFENQLVAVNSYADQVTFGDYALNY